MLRPRLTDAARAELAHAIVWYRTEAGPERATDFRNAIKRVLIRASRFPLSARVIDQADGLDLHGFVVSRYPYIVITAPIEQELIVFAVAHQSQEPGYWKPRLAKVRP